jgi:hypothetical protein
MRPSFRGVPGIRETKHQDAMEKNILDGEKRKNCFVRAITTINHRRFGDGLRVSTVFSVGI